MKEHGEIIKVNKDTVDVRIARNSACSKCGACQLGAHQDEMILTVQNNLDGKVGDVVELELQSEQVLKASFITYIIPLMSLILGIFTGYFIGNRTNGNSELFGAIGGILFTIISFLLIRIFEPLFKRDSKFSPRIVNISKNSKR